MKSFLLFAVILLVGFSCIDEAELKPVFPTSFLHDDNSKLWQLAQNGNYWPRKPFNRVVFFNDGTCYFHQKSDFSDLKSIKKKYKLNIDDNDSLFILLDKHKPDVYTIELFTKNKIVLKSKTEQKKDPFFNESIVLVPYRKPF